MDLPKPPQEIELRNIIDKLAQFVARNGPEFELMTKNKQKGNPKFSFLFGGEHFNYYQYKVTTEQAILKQKASRESTSQPGQLSNHLPTHSGQINNQIPTQLSGQIANPLAPQIGTMGGQLATQISNQIPPNLPNQWTSTSPHQNLQSLETVRTQQAQLQEQISQSELNLTAHHSVLMQQQRAQIDEALAKVQSDTLTCEAQELRINLNELDNLLQPIMDSCTKDSISTGKGWILHHCTSPQTNGLIARYLLKKVLNSTLFTQKLHIVYLVNDVLHHCVRKSADQLKCALESVVIPMFCHTSISANDEQQAKLNKLLSLWESKNNYFDSSVLEKLRQPAHSWSEYQANLITTHASVITPITTATKMALEGFQAQHQAFVQHALQQIQALEQQKQTLEAQASQVVQASQPPPNQSITSAPPPMGTATDGLTGHPPPIGSEITQPPPEINFSQPPPGYPPTPFIPGVELPDFSKPPPGFPATNPDELVPGVPYYDLPAGLMVPLIKLEDAEYKPLDPDCIRLPPPAPPTDRLLAAMEAFYAPPCHERPRDSEGWEKLGLYEYYRAKNSARKKKEEDILSGLRPRSRSPSPIIRTRSKSRSPPRKRYRSETPPPKRPTNSNEFEEKSRSPQPASAAPTASIDAHSPGAAASSNIPEESEENEPNVTTLPQLLEPPDKLLDEKNKGHQMLRKMGWSGAGLGAKEQGIEQPISGGEVRDRVDMFKGLGVNLSDPYENFRKSKGQAFINRMKARAEERL